MHPVRGFRRLALLLAALALLVVAAPATSTAAGGAKPQCSDGVDNDGDGAIDGADAGCTDGTDNDESDSPYGGIVFITIPLPVVTLSGTVNPKGVVKVAKFLIRAQRGSTVTVACTGSTCPFKKMTRVMLTTSLRLGKLERKYTPTMTLRIRVARPGQLGKYVSYKIRRKKAPLRTDLCLDQSTGKVRGCFVG